MSEIQIQLSLDWSSERPDTQMANAVHVQRFGEDVVLSLGIAVTPFALTGMSPEEITEYLKTHKVPVQQIRRAVMPFSVAQEMVSQILANLPASSAGVEEQSGQAQSDQEES